MQQTFEQAMTHLVAGLPAVGRTSCVCEWVWRYYKERVRQMGGFMSDLRTPFRRVQMGVIISMPSGRWRSTFGATNGAKNGCDTTSIPDYAHWR